MDGNNMNNDMNYTNTQPPVQEQKGMSLASMILGICGFVAWCIPLIGYPVTIVGFILGIIGMKKGGKGMAIAGIIMCVITFVITLINSILGAMIATGAIQL